MKKITAISALLILMAGAAFAQAPGGLTFSGSVITGLRFTSLAFPNNKNILDIYAGDDYLVGGDTAALRAALNQGTYGANFGLSLSANNSHDAFWTPAEIYVSEASLWAKFLDNKVGVKAGYFSDFDYFSPVMAWSLAGGAASDSIQLTAYPIEGLQIDVRTKNKAGSTAQGTWFDAEQWAKNVDIGVRYSNPSFTVFAAFDDNWTPASAFAPLDAWQADAFLYFGYTGIPGLTASVETKFLDLFSERQDIAGKAVGITNVTALQVAYQITGDLSARAWFFLGGAAIGGPGMTAAELLGADGFTLGVNAEVGYQITDSLKFTLTPIFQIPNTENSDIFDFSVKPKLAWTIAPFPYAATINFFYNFAKFGKGGGLASMFTEESPIVHTISVTFGWNF
jgi:hypothetical protein